MSRPWTEPEVAAFVDGELEGADAERIAAIIDTDPEARALAERLGHANALLREAFDAPMGEPAPAALTAAILDSPTRSLGRRPRPRPAWIPMAMAAAIALAVGLGAGAALFGSDDQSPIASLGVGPAPAAVRTALETTPSGSSRANVYLVASFTGHGQVCREFETLDTDGAPTAAGVACRDPRGTWSILAVAAVDEREDAAENGYLPAAGAALDSLAILLDAIGVTAALSPADEAARIAAGWK